MKYPVGTLKQILALPEPILTQFCEDILITKSEIEQAVEVLKTAGYEEIENYDFSDFEFTVDEKEIVSDAMLTALRWIRNQNAEAEKQESVGMTRDELELEVARLKGENERLTNEKVRLERELAVERQNAHKSIWRHDPYGFNDYRVTCEAKDGIDFDKIIKAVFK
jgi:chlorite dismutase